MLPVPGILRICNYLQNAVATTYIFVLQLSTFIFYNKHAEEVIYSATQMLAAERRNRVRLGKLADIPVYSIPYPQIKKIAALKNHIWGL